MKISFDIKYRPQIESGEYKVETRDGRPVKVISFEMTDTNDCPIAAQFRLCAGTPVVYLFDKEGHYKGEGDSDYDLLLITPEPELTEFEEHVKRLLDFSVMLGSPYEIDSVKSEAAELLELARKELIEEELTSDFRKTNLYKLGKVEALEDLPRWKPTQNNSLYPVVHFSEKDGVAWLRFGKREIKVLDLEKLPGF